MEDLDLRAARHAALGDPLRLRIVDTLAATDLTPGQLGASLGVPSNLLAHHLQVLEAVGIVERRSSSGDRRRRYVRLRHDVIDSLGAARRRAPVPALFVCSANSARSQLAAALWWTLTAADAQSAGTRPAARVHPRAAAAARRAGVRLRPARPRHLDEVGRRPPLVVTVCDQAREELRPEPSWLHWSIPDPVTAASDAAFDAVVAELRDRITHLVTPTGDRP